MNLKKLPLWIVIPSLTAVTLQWIVPILIPQQPIIRFIITLWIIGVMPIYGIHFYINIRDWNRKRRNYTGVKQ